MKSFHRRTRTARGICACGANAAPTAAETANAFNGDAYYFPMSSACVAMLLAALMAVTFAS